MATICGAIRLSARNEGHAAKMSRTFATILMSSSSGAVVSGMIRRSNRKSSSRHRFFSESATMLLKLMQKAKISIAQMMKGLSCCRARSGSWNSKLYTSQVSIIPHMMQAARHSHRVIEEPRAARSTW